MMAPLPTDMLSKVGRYLDSSVSLTNLARHDWRRQTDTLQQAFIIARLFADMGDNLIFVDGHINDHLKRHVVENGISPKQFFNRRLHDAGYKWRRVLIFDTVSTNKMGKRARGRDKLHFHAIFELPEGWSRAALLRLLEKAFGKAVIEDRKMGRRQLHVSSPDWEQHHTYSGVKMSGPLGKWAYAISHSGATYRDLKLNGGKRSRKSPAVRGACNRQATGLAKGIPSNFNASVVFCDAASKRAGKETFDAWIKAGRETNLPKSIPAKQAPDEGNAIVHIVSMLGKT